MERIKRVFEYKTMIASLIKRDLRGRYKGSVLGFAWTFINPLLQLGVYTLVFSVIMRNGIEDYYLFLFVALIPWIFFATSVSAGSTCIIAQKNLVEKIYFPREVLPISFVTAQLVNMLLSMLVVLAVLLFSGKGVSLALLYLPIIVVVEYLLALGLALIMCALTVYLRDLEYLLGIITMAWQFLSPVLYSINDVPERLRPIFQLNPMSPVITAYRDILYYKTAPQLQTLLSAILMGVLFLILGWVLFGHLQKHFVEEL